MNFVIGKMYYINHAFKIPIYNTKSCDWLDSNQPFLVVEIINNKYQLTPWKLKIMTKNYIGTIFVDSLKFIELSQDSELV